jgi:thiol-disulfide isomerase/thioredoxin
MDMEETPMRSLRNSMAAACALALAPTLAVAETKPKVLLDLCGPTQKGVEYDTPTDPAAIDACKVETVTNAQKKSIGYALRDGQGKLLRKFVDSDGNGTLDQWSYYQDGFEVYRDIDLNGDKVADECRWLNAGGTRVATLVKGKVAAWKRISAEEASKVLVQALVSGDLALLETVLATPEELSALGVPKGMVDQVAAAAARRVEQVRALQKGLTGWDSKTVWNRLDGMMPHLIPAEAGGLKGDLTLYENAVIFAGPASGPANPAQVAFLQAPELIKVGEVWKFVELPRAVDASKPVVASEGGLRSWLYRGEAAAGAPASDPKLEAALKELAQYDGQAPNLNVAKEVAQFHVGRIPLLRNVVKAAQNPDEQLVYDKQIVDSLAAAYQTGLYPKGLEPLNVYIEQGGKAGSYAAFRKLSAEFAARNDEPGANVMQSQKKWMADLKAFLDKYPKADEAPDALLQLASINEFNAEEDEARKYYDRLARDFPQTDDGQKAAGALRRLDLVGKPFALKGAGLRNETVDTAQYRGKTVLVMFWAAWADPVKRDLPELIKAYQKHRAQGFEVVGVCLDNERAALDEFLKETPLPWPQIFEPGGLEKNRLAAEYGIIALPTMILVDPQGKVVNRNIRTAAELEKQLEALRAGKGDGVALGAK